MQDPTQGAAMALHPRDNVAQVYPDSGISELLRRAKNLQVGPRRLIAAGVKRGVAPFAVKAGV